MGTNDESTDRVVAGDITHSDVRRRDYLKVMMKYTKLRQDVI